MHQKKQFNFDEIIKLVDSPMKKGDTWYLLYKDWFDYCKKYHTTNDPSDHPGPIDNSNLFQPIEATPVETNSSNQISHNNSSTSTTCNVLTRSKSSCSSPVVDAISADSRPLRSDLSEAEGHFLVVPEECWNALTEQFGIVSPNHAIKRRVIEIGSGQTIVEIRPISLKICLYGKEGTVEKCFSRKTTFEEFLSEVKKMYNISNEKEIQLWVNSTCYSFKQNVLSPSNLDNNNQSPIKPPPTPPPMPKNSQSSPTVVTRQEANSMMKPIALPDSSIFSDSTNLPDSGSSNAMPKSSTLSLNETLDDAGISDSTLVTIELINKDGNWPSSRPRFGTVSTRSSKAQPGLCGLSNMGNTCFMNAALQCLSNTPPLTNYILTDRFVADINTNNPLGMHGEIARTYAELIKVMWSGNHSAFLPREFKCAVSRFAPQFNGFAQQDSQELMSFLLDGLHEDLNRIKNKPYIEVKSDNENRPDEIVAKESWSNYKKRNDSIVVDTFHGLLKSTLVCPGCKLVSVTFDPFCYLSLPLPVKREKQVNLTFLPAASPLNESTLKTVYETLNSEDIKTIKSYGASITSFSGFVEENAGYYDPKSRPRSCKMQVPRSGPASEICEIVARIVNEESLSSNHVKPNNLVVAELSVDHKITKVYESTEHYNQIGDDIVVVEKKSNYVIPIYLRERKNPNSMAGSVITRPMFLHVPDLRFDTLYRSVIASLSNLTSEVHETLNRETWFSLSPPASNPDGDSVNSELMDCDDDQNRPLNRNSDNSEDHGPANGDGLIKMDTAGSDNVVKMNGNGNATAIENSPSQEVPFVLSIVNSFGSHTIETLGPQSDECNYVSKLYLGATFTAGSSAATLDAPQFAHLRNPKSGDNIEGFTPKFSPKPILQLKDCITQFTTVEKLGVDNEWYCPKCKKHQQATKKFDIWSLPKVLIIHLKRFSFSRSWRDKIDTMVEFPVENLDMSKYVLDPKQKQKTMNYNLIGISNHFGGLGGGHYSAYAKNAIQDSWYNFDDALVTPTNASNVVTKSAYVLFYQLQDSQLEAC